MMRSFATLAGLAVLALNPRPVASQQSPPALPAAAQTEILVLGTFHMANPGRDINNMQVDDVLAPKRQREIADVMAVLKKFNPTKVAVEAAFNSDATPKRYLDYIAGKHELTRNETEQLGFRLAKELGHKAIYAVDADGEFPYPRVVDFAKARDRSKEFDALMAESSERVKATNAYLTSHSVLETLLYMNSDDYTAAAVGFYYRLAHFTEPWNWAGPDLVADWTRRNLRIYGNVIRLADTPNERIIVIYGAGHVGWLQQAFGGDPSVRLRKLAEFAK
jgi:hypothetical protein